ncbi:MAG: DUF4142 domain-containing protein [Asticcacaulis sp.]|nr:DUF4142 domain-containing protein [Asticcacaulis sp.]
MTMVSRSDRSGKHIFCLSEFALLLLAKIAGKSISYPGRGISFRLANVPVFPEVSMSSKFGIAASLAFTCALAAGSAFATDKPVDFVTKAGQGDMFEVQLAKIALQKSKNPEVRGFATQMIDDHSKSGKELKAVAAKSHIRVPTKLDSDYRKKLADFSKKTDSFDCPASA